MLPQPRHLPREPFPPTQGRPGICLPQTHRGRGFSFEMEVERWVEEREHGSSLGERDGKQQKATLETRAAHLGIGDVNEKKF